MALLRPGEQLLWTGRPDPSALLLPSDRFAIPLSLGWVFFMAMWLIGAVSSGMPRVMIVAIGVMVGMLVLYALVGRFVVRWWRAGRLRYGLTDRRAIVLSAGGSTWTDAAVAMGGPVTTNRARDGRHGSVEFVPSADSRYPNWFTESGFFPWMRPGNVAFQNVTDFDALATAVESAQRAHEARRSS